MNVTVRLFAVARQAAGRPEVVVALDETATVGDLRRALAAAYPALAPIVGAVRFAVDDAYADDDRALTERSEIALIPPVSGGAPDPSPSPRHPS